MADLTDATRLRSFALTIALGLSVAGLAPAAAAQTAPPAQAASDRRSELARLEDEIKLSDETVERLQSEIKALDADRMKLRADLLETAARTRALESKILGAEMRLASLTADEEMINASLRSRQRVLVEVMASLQRLGRHPPPALFVKPEDALDAVRSAMLLGAVLPELREETKALARDLANLARVRREIVTERDALKVGLVDLAESRKRIDLLVEERQRVLAQQERSLAEEQSRISALSRNAASLKDLIASMEREVATARRAAAEADAAAAAQAKAPPVLRPSLAAVENPNRLSPALPFEEAKGFLRLPVSGPAVRNFGQDDGRGGQEKGLWLAAGASATVTAPCDGWVVYAGPFRSYGQLLIINAGGGYHVVLAGMARIDVALGQFVLTGEPVAAMGSGEMKVASVEASAAPQPTLYVEFRRNGLSIDPTPWWAPSGEKARG